MAGLNWLTCAVPGVRSSRWSLECPLSAERVHAQVREWAAAPEWQLERGETCYAAAYEVGRRGGHALMDYCVPNTLPSVVLGRHLTGCAPVPPSTPLSFTAAAALPMPSHPQPLTPLPCPLIHSAGMPAALPRSLERRLAACAISRLVIGHTPHGNCPTVIKSEGGAGEARVDVIMGDTSYSDMRSLDNRGLAASEIRL